MEASQRFWRRKVASLPQGEWVMSLLSLREQIVFEVYRSGPSCGINKECDTQCGTCGADRILSLILKEVEGIENKEEHAVWYEGANFETDYKVIEHCFANCPACAHNRAIQAVKELLGGKECL